MTAWRAFYLLQFGAMGALFPFLPILLQQRGLGAFEVSQVMVTLPVLGFFVPPLWGLVADALQRRLLLLRVATASTALAVLALLLPSSFWGILTAMALMAIVRTPIVPLADSVTFEALGESAADYSQVRVWGSLGFALFAAAAGAISQRTSVNSFVIVASVAFGLAALCTWPMPSPRAPPRAGVTRQALAELRRPRVALLLLGNVLYYSGHSIYDAYFGLHAVQLGHGESYVGMTWAVAVGVEVLVLTLAPRFVLRLRPETWLLICTAAAVLRWLLCAGVEGAVPLTAVQALHGLTFGLWYLSMVTSVQKGAAPSLRSSLQTLASSSLGLGMVAGYLVGGLMFERASGAAAFSIAAAFAACALAVYTGLYRVTR